MTELYKTQKFRPVEILIMLLVCLFLLAIVPLACRRVRSDDYRAHCSTNLTRIGKAALIYANDYDDEFPRSGGRNSIWSPRIHNWKAGNRFEAYGLTATGNGGMGSISSCLYLLVKYAEAAPRSFVCKSDLGTSEFEPLDDGTGDRELSDLWDFGIDPPEHCSYSYHSSFNEYALSLSSEPGMTVVADRNPYIESPMAEPKDISLFVPEGNREAVKVGNAVPHDEEGQNVLFLDGHVNFEEAPYCGFRADNIYTYWDGGDIRRGATPLLGSEPQDRTDSLLVHDGSDGEVSSRGEAPPPKRRTEGN